MTAVTMRGRSCRRGQSSPGGRAQGSGQGSGTRGRDDPKARLNAIRLRTHKAIAQKIDADPGLLDVPLRNLDRWRLQRGYEPSAHVQWRALLMLPWCWLREVLVSEGEESVRLRQSTPFTGILTPCERRRIHAEA